MVIPILNEAGTLRQTLDSLLSQDYPFGLLEILVIDGGSDDDWEACLPAPAACPVRIRTLHNPRRTTAAAINLALASTDADAILWLSGHSPLAPNYVTAVVAAYEKHPGQVIGGRLAVEGHGPEGRLNAMVLSSRFGTGMAPLRFEEKPGPTESVTFALYDRRCLIAVGGLDERLVRNQDTDLWHRLRQIGVGFRRVDAVATYLAPATVAGLWLRAFNNGRWNIWGQRIRRGGLSWWHFAPMAMVGGGATLAAFSLISAPALALLSILAGLYLVLAVAHAVQSTLLTRTVWAVVALPFAFLAHHVVYGLGTWCALVTRVPRTRDDHAGHPLQPPIGVLPALPRRSHTPR
ncbi:MAG TPA: glycosyltransferase [Acidobacteriota bacterium]|nr:glycosyltransferase [Acidobacteriota bacterium]